MRQVYYIGLIDILKRAEKKPKAAPKKKDDEGDPAFYASRLESYINSATAPPAVPLTALEVLSATAKP